MPKEIQGISELGSRFIGDEPFTRGGKMQEEGVCLYLKEFAYIYRISSSAEGKVSYPVPRFFHDDDRTLSQGFSGVFKHSG